MQSIFDNMYAKSFSMIYHNCGAIYSSQVSGRRELPLIHHSLWHYSYNPSSQLRQIPLSSEQRKLLYGWSLDLWRIIMYPSYQ